MCDLLFYNKLAECSYSLGWGRLFLENPISVIINVSNLVSTEKQLFNVLHIKALRRDECHELVKDMSQIARSDCIMAFGLLCFNLMISLLEMG